MYQLSRSLYRELSPLISEGEGGCTDHARQYLLDTSERWMKRIALTPDTCANPARSVFRDIRHLFPFNAQPTVWGMVRVHVAAAQELSARLERILTRDCQAFTRGGSRCRREPRPGWHYCPSHRHLEEAPAPRGEALALVGSGSGQS